MTPAVEDRWQPDRRRTWLRASQIRRLLAGGPTTRDLLGLLAVSRGTLTGVDLRALTDADPQQIEDTLHAVCGRRQPRDVTDVSDDNEPPAGYRLTSPHLSDSIVDALGPARAEDYRQQLHAWADSYRTAVPGLRPAWPAETPAYLLTDYPHLLAFVDDLDRLTALATDGTRQARILEMTDGRAVALAEIALGQSRHLLRSEPDLASMALLSYRRRRLEPCGQADHDEEAALASLAGALAESGEHDRAAAVAREVTSRTERTRALAALAAAADGRERATNLAAEIEAEIEAAAAPPEADTAAVLMDAAEAGVRARPGIPPGLAEELSRRARSAAYDRYLPAARQRAAQQRAMRADLVKALAAAGDHRRALRAAGLIADDETLVRALLSLIQADLADGRAKPRRRPISKVGAVIMRMSRPSSALLSAAVQTLARAGEHEMAAAIATRAREPGSREDLRGEVARAIAQAGDIDRAESIIAEAGADGRAERYPRNVIVLARATAEAGQPARAERIARALPHPAARVWALSELADVAARSADHPCVRRLTHDAEHIARRIVIDRQDRAFAMLKLAGMLALAGDLPRAEQTIRRLGTVHDPDHHYDGRAAALAALAGLATAAGDPGSARRLAEEALRRVGQVTSCDHPHRQQVLIDLAGTAGEPHGRRFLAQVYAQGCWVTPLTAAPTRYPQVLHRLAEAVLTDRGTAQRHRQSPR